MSWHMSVMEADPQSPCTTGSQAGQGAYHLTKNFDSFCFQYQVLCSNLILVITNLFHPVNSFSLKFLLNSNVRHGHARRRSVPIFLSRRYPDHVTRTYYYSESYFPVAQKNKSPRSWQKEDQCFRLWIAPVLAEKPLKDVAFIHLERIKKNMADAGRAARSITYCLAVVRQTFNFARNYGIFEGINPVTKIKKPSEDNRRVRFLTHEEADKLLQALAERAPKVRDMALQALHCGLCAGEIFGLEWGDVDLERRVITLRGTSARAGTTTKSGKTRQALMTSAVAEMFAAKGRRGQNELVFPAENGGKIIQISDSFERTVAALGLNSEVTDSRQKVVFHSLRHTFASWLVEQGVDLYVVKELMGHGTLAMTERYSHLSPDKLHGTVRTLEAGMEKAKASGKKVVRLGD